MGTGPSIGVTRNYWQNYQTQCNQNPNAVKKSYANMVFLNINPAQTPVPAGFTPSSNYMTKYSSQYTKPNIDTNILVNGNAPANMNTDGLTNSYQINGVCLEAPVLFPSYLDFYFNGIIGQFSWSNPSFLISTEEGSFLGGILFGLIRDEQRRNVEFWYSGILTNGTTKYTRIVYYGKNLCNDQVPIEYEIRIAIDTFFQYIEIRTKKVPTIVGRWNIFIGQQLLNTCGDFDTTGGPQNGGSYVFRSDLQGNNWQFFRNSHLIHL